MPYKRTRDSHTLAKLGTWGSPNRPRQATDAYNTAFKAYIGSPAKAGSRAKRDASDYYYCGLSPIHAQPKR